jgi:hypothetical protein
MKKKSKKSALQNPDEFYTSGARMGIIYMERSVSFLCTLIYTDVDSTDIYNYALEIKKITGKLANNLDARFPSLQAVQEAESHINHFFNLIMHKKVSNPLISDVIIYEVTKAMVYARTAIAYIGFFRKNQKAYRASLFAGKPK